MLNDFGPFHFLSTGFDYIQWVFIPSGFLPNSFFTVFLPNRLEFPVIFAEQLRKYPAWLTNFDWILTSHPSILFGSFFSSSSSYHAIFFRFWPCKSANNFIDIFSSSSALVITKDKKKDKKEKRKKCSTSGHNRYE